MHGELVARITTGTRRGHMSQPKYAVHAGHVISMRDGDRHFITADQVARCYGLKRHEWVRWPEVAFTLVPDGYIHLWPDGTGKYILPKGKDEK